MVYKIIIKDNEKSPLNYISNLANFKNGKEYKFEPGVNIIVGENGCGKTTLMKIIASYLLVDGKQCGKGIYCSVINSLFEDLFNHIILDGIDVYADYNKNTFRLQHKDEKTNDDILSNFNSFGEFFAQNCSSTGEGVLIAIDNLFKTMFSKQANLTFNYESLRKDYPEYLNYIDNHKVNEEDAEYTILMDEPDRNLSLDNIESIINILSYHKPQTQVIAVVHNPFLIHILSKNKNINFIEMTNKYVKKVNNKLSKLQN